MSFQQTIDTEDAKLRVVQLKLDEAVLRLERPKTTTARMVKASDKMASQYPEESAPVRRTVRVDRDAVGFWARMIEWIARLLGLGSRAESSEGHGGRVEFWDLESRDILLPTEHDRCESWFNRYQRVVEVEIPRLAEKEGTRPPRRSRPRRGGGERATGDGGPAGRTCAADV